MSVTIAAKSKFPTVTGDVLVIFKTAKFDTATIHGSITGAAAHDVATLFAQPFPYKHAPARTGTPITLTGTSPETYSFTVKPAIATRYTVQVSPAGSPRTQLGKSSVQTVYITPGGRITGVRVCSRPICREKLRFYIVVPASVRRREGAKYLYFYFGHNIDRKKTPKAPKTLSLRTRRGATRARRISATEYERTVSWSFYVGDDGYNWLFAGCTKDTEANDGVGLPGHHGCGGRRISAKTVYIG